MGKPFAAPSELPREPRTDLVTLRCTFCHGGLPRAGAVFCAGCLAPHHADCRREHGACAAPGCGEPLTLTPHEARRPRRWRGGTALALVVLASSGLLAGLRGESVAEPGRAAQHEVAAVAAVAPPSERMPAHFTQVEFVAGGYTHPVSLGLEQCVILSVDEEGYTNVFLCPSRGSDSWVHGTLVLVAEPGQTVELRAPNGSWPLAPSPGTSLRVLATANTPPQIVVNALH